VFARLAAFSHKYRVAITVVWAVVAVALFITAPHLSRVGVTDESQFLPRDSESVQAHKLLNEKFATAAQRAISSGLIVIYNEQGLGDADMERARAIHDWLVSGSAPKTVKRVTSIFEEEVLRSKLVSADGTTMLMLVEFSVTPLSDEGKETVSQIRDYLHHNYPCVQLYLSGEIGFFHDMFLSIQETVRRAHLITIILVAILLLIIYRSPVAIFVPLIAIGCSFAVARGILGFMAAAGVPIATLVDAYLAAVIFGVGTDYCLFIVSRFREELSRRERQDAHIFAMSRVGAVIAASALTVVVAFLALAISRFGMTRTAGYSLAIGVAITLVAGLTLVPALMSLFGRHLFWPGKNSAGKRRRGPGWMDIGRWISQHPVVAAVVPVALLLLPYPALLHFQRTADIISQIPTTVESARGYRLVAEHFPIGEFSPAYLLVQLPSGDISSPASREAVDRLAKSLEEVPGVARVDYYAAPEHELTELAGEVRGASRALAGGDLAALQSLRSCGDVMQKLALQYPGIVHSPNFQKVVISLKGLAAMSGQMPAASDPQAMAKLLAGLGQVLPQLADSLEALAGEFRLETQTAFTQYLMDSYFSTDRTIARINVIPSADPYSLEAVDMVGRLRQAVSHGISASNLRDSRCYVGGVGAILADILSTNDTDFARVAVLATVGILLVIVVLLRSLLAPLYMVLTVLFTYGATLGIATWLFLDIVGHPGIMYLVPVFIFVVVVALGADYNIFLMSRIREEMQQRSVKEAVAHAVGNTGGVITGCGIILAGTFATLATSPLRVVLQIGAAIALGVLIDTFIVRAFLMPAIARLAGRWSWWPSRAAGRQAGE